MITIFKDDNQQSEESVNDLRELLNPNQFLITQKQDALRASRVLGTSNTSIERVVWQKPGRGKFTDHIITLG